MPAASEATTVAPADAFALVQLFFEDVAPEDGPAAVEAFMQWGREHPDVVWAAITHIAGCDDPNTRIMAAALLENEQAIPRLRAGDETAHAIVRRNLVRMRVALTALTSRRGQERPIAPRKPSRGSRPRKTSRRRATIKARAPDDAGDDRPRPRGLAPHVKSSDRRPKCTDTVHSGGVRC
jgi:hypothetical protein